MTPTISQFEAYQQIFDYFNAELFENSLPNTILNFSRKGKNVGGFFAPERWKKLFASFCPYLKQPLHISVIERNDKDIELMLKRLQRAWEYIENEAEAFEVELPYTINNRSSLLCSGDSINGQSIVVVEEK